MIHRRSQKISCTFSGFPAIEHGTGSVLEIGGIASCIVIYIKFIIFLIDPSDLFSFLFCCLIKFWVFSASSIPTSERAIKVADGSRFVWLLTGQHPYIFH